MNVKVETKHFRTIQKEKFHSNVDNLMEKCYEKYKTHV